MNKEAENRVLAIQADCERRDYALKDGETLIDLKEVIWYPPYGQDVRHYHNCIEIGVCVQGTGVVVMGRQTHEFYAGTVVVIPAGLHHSQQNQGDSVTCWRYAVVDERRFVSEIPARCRAEVMRFLQQGHKGGLVMNSGETHAQILFILERMFAAYNKSAGRVQGEIEALLLMLLVCAAREPIQEESSAVNDPLGMKSIEPALTYVNGNYHQEIRVQQMARACAMSESHFRKVFSQLMGVAPLEYVNRHRVHRAMHLLCVTDSSIQDVALDCGFPSVSTFVRNFIRYVGQNPSSWRRKHGDKKKEKGASAVKNGEAKR